MDNKKLTRENINYQLTGLGMQLRYLRDALMCTFMDIPVDYFFELRGNLPVGMDERMQFLERMVAAVDVESCKEAKSHIFNTNDKELAVKFCELDLVVWQLVMLCTRYEEKHPTVERIAVGTFPENGDAASGVFQIQHGGVHPNEIAAGKGCQGKIRRTFCYRGVCRMVTTGGCSEGL